MLSFKDMQRMRLGGPQDALSLAAISAGLFATHPYLAGHLPASLSLAGGFAGAALGGFWLASRALQPWAEQGLFKSELKLRSSRLPYEPPAGGHADGMLVGYLADTGKPLILPYEDLMRHGFIVGQSGVGKTVLGRLLMFQQIINGGGLIFIDGKLNIEELETIHAYCAWAGRSHDLLVINPGEPDLSNTYNPILFGDPDEVAARVLSLIPSTENNPGADHYKQSANQGVATLIAALNRAKLSYNFIDLTILLMSQKALAYLENRVPPSPEKANLKLFLDQYRSVSREGISSIDIKRLKETFGGVGGRMFMFGTGKFGQVMNTYTPEVNLFEAIKRNKIVYVMLPTMGKDVAAQNFGKMVVGDLRTAISWVQRLPETEKPWPPYLCFFDEAGSYVNAAWSRMFEQARSAHICLLPAVQTLANLESVSPELKEMVIGNTWTKFIFKLGTQETAEGAADLIGLEKAVTRSLSSTGSQSDSTNRANASPDGGVSQGSGLATQEREEEVYKVSTDDLKALDKGEAIVTFGGSSVYHVRIPMISVLESVAADIGAVKLNHYRPRFATGIDLFRRTDQYLSGADRQELGKG
jgi:hypothetical protein